MRIELLNEGFISKAKEVGAKVGAKADPASGSLFFASMVPSGIQAFKNLKQGGRDVKVKGETEFVPYDVYSDPENKNELFYNPHAQAQDMGRLITGGFAAPMSAIELTKYSPKLKNYADKLSPYFQKPFMAGIALSSGAKALGDLESTVDAFNEKNYQKALEKTTDAMNPAATTIAALASVLNSTNPLIHGTFARDVSKGGGAGLYDIGKVIAQGKAQDWGDVATTGLDLAAGAGLKHLYAKEMAKQALKSGVKKIPGLAWAPGIYFGGEQLLKGAGEAWKGNWGRAAARLGLAGAEVASGLAGSVPGIGTGVGFGIDVASGAGEKYLEDTEEVKESEKIKESIERKIRLNLLFEQLRERSDRDRDREGREENRTPREQARAEAAVKAARKRKATASKITEPEIKSDAKPTEPLIIDREKTEREEREKTEKEEREKTEKEKKKGNIWGTLAGTAIGAMVASGGEGQRGGQSHLYSDPRDTGELGYAPHEILGSTSKVPVQVFNPNGGSYWITQKTSQGSSVINEAKLAPKESLQRKVNKQRYKVSYVQDGKKVEVFASSIRGVRRVVYGKKQYRVHNSTGSDVTGYFKKLLGE